MHRDLSYDVIIAGLGAMGSATAFQLARRGARVLGLDRHRPPHAHGSSHGDSRIIREAYFEHPVYVPLVQRALALWRELERRSGRALLLQTGGLMIGDPQSDLVTGSLRSARMHGLAHEVLSAADVRSRYPALQADRSMVGVFEPGAGVLFPETCVATMLDQARESGATLRFDEPVHGWSADGERVRVTTANGEYVARRFVIAAGAWIRALVPALDLPLHVERQVLHWFEAAAAPETLTAARCPVHLWQFDGRRFFYGFPDLGRGAKLAFHHDGASTSVEAVRRDVDAGEVEALRAVLRRFVPAANGRLRASVVCMYTNTRDEHFWIDRHPQHAEVIIASACSGHGFKFAPAIGEILADMAQDKSPPFDLRLFRAR